jgi:hypothetical protein
MRFERLFQDQIITPLSGTGMILKPILKYSVHFIIVNLLDYFTGAGMNYSFVVHPENHFNLSSINERRTC